MENNKQLAEPIRVSVSPRLLGSREKHHTMGWERRSVMSAHPRGASRAQGNNLAHHLWLAVGGFTSKGSLKPHSSSHTVSVSESAKERRKSMIFKSDRTWIQVLLLPLRTWASSWLSRSLCFYAIVTILQDIVELKQDNVVEVSDTDSLLSVTSSSSPLYGNQFNISAHGNICIRSFISRQPTEPKMELHVYLEAMSLIIITN